MTGRFAGPAPLAQMVLIGILLLALTACGATGTIKDFEADDGNATFPSLAIEKRTSDKSRVMVSVERAAGSDRQALTLFSARPQRDGFFPSPAQPESRFEYQDTVLTGHAEQTEDYPDDRFFSADFTYDSIKGGVLHAPFGDNRVRFDLGALLEVGELDLDVAETYTTSPGDTFTIRRTDVSVGLRVGMNWKIAGPLELSLYRERFFAPSQDVQSSRLVIDLEYRVTPRVRVQYGYRRYGQEDDSEPSSVEVSAAGQHIGLVFDLR